MSDVQDPRLPAAVALLGRTGATEYRTGYSDPEQGEPVVWWAAVRYGNSKAEAAAAMNPLDATLRLCEQLIDGGQCTHCGHLTAFGRKDPADDKELKGLGLCVYGWDPELATFRRSCAGDAS